MVSKNKRLTISHVANEKSSEEKDELDPMDFDISSNRHKELLDQAFNKELMPQKNPQGGTSQKKSQFLLHKKEQIEGVDHIDASENDFRSQIESYATDIA